MLFLGISPANRLAAIRRLPDDLAAEFDRQAAEIATEMREGWPWSGAPLPMVMSQEFG
jgi:hypothetical protein